MWGRRVGKGREGMDGKRMGVSTALRLWRAAFAGCGVWRYGRRFVGTARGIRLQSRGSSTACTAGEVEAAWWGLDGVGVVGHRGTMDSRVGLGLGLRIED